MVFAARWSLAIALAIGLIFIAGLLVGHRPVDISQLLALMQGNGSLLSKIAVWELRIPRNILALLTGAGLATAGAIMQGVTRNPLASPGLTGVVSGASLAIVLVVSVWSLDAKWLPAAGLAGGVLAGCTTFMLAWQGRMVPVRIVLAGVAVTAICSAMSTAVLLFSGAEASELFFWLAGGLSGRGWLQVEQIWLWLISLLLLSFVFVRRFNLLMLEDEIARSLGLAIVRWRLFYLLLSLLMAVAVVCVAGPIAFVGLVVPHITRRLLGPQHSLWLPFTALVGAGLMLCADLLARMLAFPQEVPLGVITALLGGPWLLFLLRQESL